MTIATLNIDWGKSYKSSKHCIKIEAALNRLDSDFLVLTECVELNLPSYEHIYTTTTLPAKGEYEGFDYGKYLKGRPANRVSIYSRIPAIRSFVVMDSSTSVAREFATELGRITLYGTIIGTRFTKRPYAQRELDNCIGHT